MTLTFPHLGPVCLPAGLLLKELGIPFIIPPQNTAETLDRGKAVSPEEICLPFKFMAGNLIQAYERGARRVLIPATQGPCRLGEYGELLKQVLTKAGYKMEWILLDTPKTIGFKQWLMRLQQAGEGKRISGAAALLRLFETVRLMSCLDSLEGTIKQKAGYAQDPSQCIRLLRSLRRELLSSENLSQGFSVIRRYERSIKELAVLPRHPVKIRITGEIYTAIESAANQNLEERLMLLGCEVIRPLTVSWWIRHTVRESVPIKRKKGSSSLPYSIGGYAKETVEEINGAKEDGVIKLMPAGCMPEIVAKAASSIVQQDKDIRVLHLIFDEMQGRAGYETRVEAFVDMLERRKGVLSGN